MMASFPCELGVEKRSTETNYKLHKQLHRLHNIKEESNLINSPSNQIFGPRESQLAAAHFSIQSGLSRHKSELVPPSELSMCSRKQLRDSMKLTGLDTLSESFKSLFVNKDSCDVILQVNGKEFHAHKTILIARSSVFAAMFRHDSLEKQTGIINIPDCDPDSFDKFLEFLYCGKLEDISFCNAFHLYGTCNKYDVQELKCFCVKYIELSLEEDTVCDIVQLAEKYNDEKLLSAAQDFFNKNMSNVVETAEWENLLKINYRLANKLLKGKAKIDICSSCKKVMKEKKKKVKFLDDLLLK